MILVRSKASDVVHHNTSKVMLSALKPSSIDQIDLKLIYDSSPVRRRPDRGAILLDPSIGPIRLNYNPN